MKILFAAVRALVPVLMRVPVTIGVVSLTAMAAPGVHAQTPDQAAQEGVIVLSVQIGALREKSSFKNNRL